MKKLSLIFSIVLCVFNLQAQTGQAFNFDGVNDYAVATNPSILDITIGTIEIRIKPQTKTTKQTILGYRSSNGGSTKYLFNLLENLSGIGFWNGNSFVTIPFAFNEDQWYNITVTDDNSGSSKLYVDGQFVGNFASEFGTATGPNLNLYIGVDFPGNEYFKGDIGDLRVWDTPKTASEILTSNSCILNVDTVGLIAHYNFNQGTADSDNSLVTTIIDAINANDLMLTNTALNGSISNWVAAAVENVSNPVAIAQDITVTLDNTDNASITVNQIDNGSFASCGIASMTVTPNTFDCMTTGTNTVTLTVTDFAGNTSMDTAVVTVMTDQTEEPMFNQGTIINTANLLTLSSAAGDIDGDGDVDLITISRISGGSFESIPALYLNDGNNNFTETPQSFANFGSSQIVMNDIDDDNDLDILIMGDLQAFGRRTYLYINDGSGNFTENTMTGLAGLRGDAEIIDVDGDGDKDIFLVGTMTAFDYQAFLFLNDGSENFTDANAGFTGISNGEVEAGDINNDGTIDAIVVGYNGTDHQVYVYTQDAMGNFTLNTTSGIPTLTFANIVLKDIDADSDLDLFISGTGTDPNDVSLRDAQLLLNNGTGIFTELNANLQDAYVTSSAITDINRDGAMDLIYSGLTPLNQYVHKIYLQDTTTGSFVDTPNNIPGSVGGDLHVMDIDNDGDIDTIKSSLYISIPGNRFYIPFINTPAIEIPFLVSAQNFTAQLDASGNATITGADVDNGSYTPCEALTLSVSPDTFDCTQIGVPIEVTLTGTNSSGESKTDVAIVTIEDNIAPLLTVQDVIVDIGLNGNAVIDVSDVVTSSSDNCNLNTVTLSQDTFSCAEVGNTLVVVVTASDFNGNSTTENVNVTINNPMPIALAKDVTLDLDSNGNLTLLPEDIDDGTTAGCIGFNSISVSPNTFTCNNLGANTVTLSMTDNNMVTYTATSTVTIESFQNETPVLTSVPNTIPALQNKGVAAGDFDNDGDVDIITAGIITTPIFTGKTRLYRNDGTNQFLEIDTALEDVHEAEFDVLDFDSDGDLDILMSGSKTGTGAVTKLYLNDGNANFTDANLGLSPLYRGDLEVVDLDGDNDLDIIYTGTTSGFLESTKVYLQDNMGNFVDSNTTISGAMRSTLSIGDVNGDMINDVFISGATQFVSGQFNFITKLYLGSSTGVFTETTTSFPVPNIAVASSDLGDVDGDGDLDLVVSGFLEGEIYFTEIYTNDSNGNFTSLNANIPPLVGKIVFVDFDGDTDLDIVYGGSNLPVRATEVYLQEDFTNTFVNANLGINTSVLDTLIVTDIDGDNDMDIIMEGYLPVPDTRPILIFTNDPIEDTAFNMLTQDITVQLDETGNATITAMDIDNGSVTTCGFNSLVLSQTDFTCANISNPVTVTLTGTNANGETASATALVTVENAATSLDATTLPMDISVQGTNANPYVLEDFTTGVTLLDVCEGNVTFIMPPQITQNPVVGSPLSPGVHVITISVTDANNNILTHTFNLTVEETLSIVDESIQNLVPIYPNPVLDGQFFMDLSVWKGDRVDITLYDITGKLIINKLIEIKGVEVFKTNTLQAGVYVLKIVNDKSSLTKRIIVKR